MYQTIEYSTSGLEMLLARIEVHSIWVY